MKKTKMLVVTAAIVLGLCGTVFAELPKNPSGSIMIGNQVYSIDYVKKNLDVINQQLMDKLDAIFFLDNQGNAKDIFTGSNTSEAQLVSKVGGTLISYDANGNTIKFVAGKDNKYINTNLSEESSSGSIIVDATYKEVSFGMKIVTLRIRNIFGVKDAAYYTVTQGISDTSGANAINDVITLLSSGGQGQRITVYDSDKNPIMFGTFQLEFETGKDSFTKTIPLQSTGFNPGLNTNIVGNTAGNISNNGFVSVDSGWIYYSNSADGNKLYKKSVNGFEDYVISEDSVKYINVTNNWVYYSNYNDGGRIYKVRLDGTQRQKVSDDMASCINVVGDTIYYINNSDNAKIYVIDSKGKRKISGDSAAYLNVVGKSIFYSNISSAKRLYGIRLEDPSLTSTKLSDIPANYINAVTENNIYYSSSDGKLYNNRRSLDMNYPVTVISNIPKKGGKDDGAMNTVQDKISDIYVDKNNNVYYKSFVDGGKLYKADSHGNGYKVTEDLVDYINVADTTDPNNPSQSDNKGYVYYLKSGKLSRVPIDSDKIVKGEVITKPKVTDKVVKVEPIPVITVDDLSTFNFPDRVSAIMSDSNIKQLVVNWDKIKPAVKNGIYTYTGTILGYGTKVNMQVALGSGMIDIRNVVVKNVPGNRDYVKVSNLEPDDIISVYDGVSPKPKVGKADKSGIANITGLNLDTMGGTITLTLTKPSKAEGGKLLVPYQAEAPSGFIVNADNNEIKGLRAGQTYIGYLYDASIMDDSKVDWNGMGGDGKPTAGKVSPIRFTVTVANDGTAVMRDNNGNNIDFATKLDANGGKDMIFRLVKQGDTAQTNSDPSDILRISRAKIADYVSIDYKTGAIMGTSTDMQFAYDEGSGVTPPDPVKWEACKSGLTPVMVNSYMQVWVKVKGNGTVLSSKAKSFSLFAPPTLTGINEGETYSKDKLPTPTWNTSPNITAEVKIYDPNKDPKEWDIVKDQNGLPITITSGSKLDVSNPDIFNVNQVYAVVLTQTKVVNGKTGFAVTVVKFKVNNAQPNPVDIIIRDKKGTKNGNTDVYYQATPTWVGSIGTDADVRLQRLAKPADVANYVVTDPWKPEYLNDNNPANDNPENMNDGFKTSERVPILQGMPIKQEGLYKLTVTIRNMETGALVPSVKYFIVDKTEVTPAEIHRADSNGIDIGIVANGTTYNELIPYIKADYDNVDIKAELIGISGVPVEIPIEKQADNKHGLGKSIPVNGSYTLRVITTNKLNGAEDSTSSIVTFNIKTETKLPEAPKIALNIEADGTFTLSKEAGETRDIQLMQYSTGASWKSIAPVDGNGKFTLTKDDIISMFQSKQITIKIPSMGGNPESLTKVITLKSQTEKPSGIVWDLNAVVNPVNGFNEEVEIKFTSTDLNTDVSKCEYSIDGGSTWTTILGSGVATKEKVAQLTQSGDILVRKKAHIDLVTNDIYVASDFVKCGLKANSQEPTNISYIDLNTGNFIGTNIDTNDLEYSVDNGQNWKTSLGITVSELPTDKKVLVRYKAKGLFLPGKALTIEVK